MRGLPDLDLLVASPCCQGFTPSGRPGRSTAHRVDREKVLASRAVARNTSFAVLQAADVRRPRRILIENVVEFLGWEGFPAWRSMLEAFGYTVREHQILARDYGSAQDRLRAIVTASLDGPIELAPTYGTERRSIGDCLLDDDDERCRWVSLDSKTESIARRVREQIQRRGSRFVWANVDSARGRTEDEGFPTFTTRSMSQLHVIDGDRIRRLEAREYARGMSLPDSYQIPERRTVADRLIGNMIDAKVSEGAVAQVLAA
jgi:DNA (cytosine-5)-methyltransferase 1